MLFVADRNPSLAQNIQPCVLFERGHTFLGRAWPLKAEDSATEVRSKAQDRLSCSKFIQVQKETCPQYGSIWCFFRLGGPGNHPKLRFLRGNPWFEGPPLKETTTKRCALWCKRRKLKGFWPWKSRIRVASATLASNMIARMPWQILTGKPCLSSLGAWQMNDQWPMTDLSIIIDCMWKKSKAASLAGSIPRSL